MSYFSDTLSPGEKRVLTFDFSADLSGSEVLSGTPTTTITVVFGTDPSPTSIQNGAITFDSTNKMVLFPMQASITNTDYNITILIGTSNTLKVLSLSGIISIRS
jgi:hypothetical protein